MTQVNTHDVTRAQVLEMSHVLAHTITATSLRVNLDQVDRFIENAASRLNPILASRGFDLAGLDEHPDAYARVQRGITLFAAHDVDRAFGLSGESTQRLMNEAMALESELRHAHLREMGDAEPTRSRRRVIGR